MRFSTPEDKWVPVGVDDDGAQVFIDPKSVRAHGLRLDRVEVTVIVKPAQDSEGLRAVQALLSNAGKVPGDAAYVEQAWVLHLHGKVYSMRSLVVKSADDLPLHSVRFSSIDLMRIEPGSVAEQVGDAVERLVREQGEVLHRPDAVPPPEALRPQMAPTMAPTLKGEPDASGARFLNA